MSVSNLFERIMGLQLQRRERRQNSYLEMVADSNEFPALGIREQATELGSVCGLGSGQTMVFIPRDHPVATALGECFNSAVMHASHFLVIRVTRGSPK